MILLVKSFVTTIGILLASSIVMFPCGLWTQDWEDSVSRGWWWTLTVWFMSIPPSPSQPLKTHLEVWDTGRIRPRAIGSGMESASKWNIPSWDFPRAESFGIVLFREWSMPALTSFCLWFTAQVGLTYSNMTARLAWWTQEPGQKRRGDKLW